MCGNQRLIGQYGGVCQIRVLEEMWNRNPQVMRYLRGEHELYWELGYTQFILYFRKVSAIFCLNSKTNV